MAKHRNIRVWPVEIDYSYKNEPGIDIVNCSSCVDDCELGGLIKYGDQCIHCSHKGCGYSSSRKYFNHRYLASEVCGKKSEGGFTCEHCNVTEVEHKHCDKCDFAGDLNFHTHCLVENCNNVVDSVENYNGEKCIDQRCDKCRIRLSGYNFIGTLSEGHGSYYESEDDWFEGMWSKGKRVSGFGIITSKNGRFVGTWKKRVWHEGSGHYNGKDCYFTGEWDKGIKWAGKGYLKLANGKNIYGTWSEGVFTSS